MKIRIITILLLIAIFSNCNSPTKKQEPIALSPDSLVSNIDGFINAKVIVEGEIVHICGITGTKMKLRSYNGTIIKISPKDSLIKYDTTYYRKKIRVTGTVKEDRITAEYIDKVENDKTLLCHIDKTPCMDNNWTRKQIEKGISDSLCKRDVDKLRTSMMQTGKSYISIVTIIVDNIVILYDKK
jgi:hypothetical protein